MIVVVDMGIGNLGAFLTMLRRLGVPAQASDDRETIAGAGGLILPGVGHFDHAARGLRDRGLESVLRHKALVEQVPVLGVCLGMQLMFERSEEGTEPGLAWVPGEVRRFAAERMRDQRGGVLPIPHMGWNTVVPTHSSALFSRGEPYRFYFVHSYHVCCSARDTSATTTYGYTFASAFQHGNLLGCQFHPEKSHRFGKELLRRFTLLAGGGTEDRRAPAGVGAFAGASAALPA